MRNHFILLTVIYFLNTLVSGAQDCPPFSNSSVSDLTPCGATLHWSYPGTANKFLLKYRESNSQQWSPTINVHADTFYHLSGLLPSTSYTILLRAVCTNMTTSQRIKTTITTPACMLPSAVSVASAGPGSVNISVTNTCDYDSLRVQYKKSDGFLNEISFSASSLYTINGLQPDSVYFFRFSTCPLAFNEWTANDTFHVPAATLSSRNVLLILIDDARYDYYSCNGGPYFLNTPNINRIANEGVNFKKSFVVSSLCAPSRACIGTGLFPTKNGVHLNGDHLDTTLMTIPKFLKSQGYYTALVGKNHGIYLNGSVPEFNFYLESNAYDSKKELDYHYNGQDIHIDKHNMLTLTDTAMALIQRMPQPFYLYLTYHDPHLPPNPLPELIGKYDDKIIPWKADTAKYSMNYPSSLYDGNGDDLYGVALDTTYRHILETVTGLDSCIGKLLEALETSGRLDSTLIIFMSDNGHMMGTHEKSGKTLAYEPSMRVPIFMRYPKWFAPSSVIKNQMALNIDIAPTIYQFTGVNYTYPLEGISLKKMYDGMASRKEFFYVMLREEAVDPAIRCIRDFRYKYIQYSCADTVEELFDIRHDSLELTNLVNDHNYDGILNIYRQKLDSMKLAWVDTFSSPIRPCYMVNPVYINVNEDKGDDETETDLPAIYPALTDGKVEIYNPWLNTTIEIFDRYGRRLDGYQAYGSLFEATLPDLPNDMYIIKLTSQGKSMTQKIILQR